MRLGFLPFKEGYNANNLIESDIVSRKSIDVIEQLDDVKTIVSELNGPVNSNRLPTWQWTWLIRMMSAKS